MDLVVYLGVGLQNILVDPLATLVKFSGLIFGHINVDTTQDFIVVETIISNLWNLF